jgi:hypothetical protein
MRPENDTLVKCYEENGIVFTNSAEVKLKQVSNSTQSSKIGGQDVVESVEEIRQLSYGQDVRENIDVKKEMEKEFSERVSRLVNLKKDEDEELRGN